MKRAIDFGNDKIISMMLRLAPPVMLVQLIQALYNIIDSFFIGRCSSSGLTALSIVYPIQLLMIAFAVGTGVGINTLIAHFCGAGKNKEGDETAGMSVVLELIMWVVFAVVCYFIMPYYAKMSTDSLDVITDVIVYGRIVSVFSIGLFVESGWTKVLQAFGNMKIPMFAQIVGAIVNIILDPVLIFGVGIFPKLGIAGAGIATVVGQIVAALIVMPKGYKKSPAISKYKDYVKKIYMLGFPNIIMQSAYTFYILGLNLILKTFSDQAVTALGLYYKWQTFFFIPLGAMQTCIVPIISFNYSAKKLKRCKDTLKAAVVCGMGLMLIGVLCFEILPSQMLNVFSKDSEVISIGTVGFKIIGISFIPMVTSLIFPVFFQAVGSSVVSSLLTIVRTVILFVPLGFIFSRLGLDYFWLTFPFTEVITTIVGSVMYNRFVKKNSILIKM